MYIMYRKKERKYKFASFQNSAGFIVNGSGWDIELNNKKY